MTGPRARRLALALAGAVVSAAALAALALRVRVGAGGGLHVESRLRWAELAAALAGVRPGWLVAFALVNVSTLGLRALQLRALARRRDGTAPRLYGCYQAVAVAMMAQNVLPARLSEAARVLALARADDVRPASATGAVVLGRVIDLVALLAATGAPLLVLSLPVARARALRLAATGGLVAAALLVVLLALVYRRRAQLEARAARLRPWLASPVAGFAAGLSALAEPRRLALAALASLGIPLTLAATYGCALYAFGLGGLPAGTALVLAAAVLCAIAVPAAPSSLGVYHAVAVWTLVALGAPPAPAAAFALATHAIGVVSFVTLGGVALAQLGGRALVLPPAPS